METTLKKQSSFQLTEKTKEWIVDIISYLFIALFIYTATNKIWEFENFRIVMGVMPIIGKYGALIAWTIPPAEIIISCLLVFPSTRKLGLSSSLALMTVFTIYLIFMVFYASDLPCNCGGVISRMSWIQHIWFNISFIILSILGVKFAEKRKITEDKNETIDQSSPTDK